MYGGIQQQVISKRFSKECSECQLNQNEIPKSDKVYISWPESNNPWERLRIDFFEV